MPKSSNSVDTVLAGLFMHPALQSGQLIHRLCLNMNVASLKRFFAENPSLADIFFNTWSLVADVDMRNFGRYSLGKCVFSSISLSFKSFIWASSVF